MTANPGLPPGAMMAGQRATFYYRDPCHILIIGLNRRRVTVDFIRKSGGHAGSQPDPPKGWQRMIRLIPRHAPRIGPCLFIASIMYWLHEG